ncbi:MAG: BlaI/MecI/CopY family transcriptional regulator [Armatimonadetes bacterium]|nr:BlaI/MecI/CopY family transcriptional regulator [Armatimonadota bacterium]
MDRNDELAPLTDVQLEVMQALWSVDEAGLGDVWSEVSKRRPLAKNTVQTLLSRLVDKGWVDTRQDGKAFLYRAVKGQGAARRQIVRRVLDAAFQGSTEGLVMALLEEKGLSKEEADRLKAVIEEAGRKVK